MLTLPNQTWREQQLGWFDDSHVIKQDQDLIDYMQQRHIRSARIHGDAFFSQYVNKVDHGSVDFIIWIENQSFNFEQLVSNINNEIANNLSPNGVLYLAVNKFLCNEPIKTTDLPDEYDYAILKYVTDNVKASMEQYFLDIDGVGTMFNWVHPLTRFYFKK
jgi:hypothetical protein